MTPAALFAKMRKRGGGGAREESERINNEGPLRFPALAWAWTAECTERKVRVKKFTSGIPSRKMKTIRIPVLTG